jgi:photosystem II stability/assembly factor-like uncharacterized protein
MDRRLVFGFLMMVSAQVSTAQSLLWTRAGAPYGGLFSSLAVDSSGTIFVGALGGTIYRSSDNGESWNCVGAGLDGQDIVSIAVSRRGTMFVVAYGGSTLRSVDGGLTWIEVGGGLEGHQVYTVAMAGDGHMIAGLPQHGVYRSSDDGETWHPSNQGVENQSIYNFAIAQDGSLYAGGYGPVVFHSTNNGYSWIRGEGFGGYYHWVLSLAVNSNGDVFAGIAWGDEQTGGVYRSTDGGIQWHMIGLGQKSIPALIVDDAGQIVAGSYPVSYRSTDGGVTWTPLDSALANRSVEGLGISNSGTFFAATRNGLFRSRDGAVSWSRADSGITAYGVLTFLEYDQDCVLAGAVPGGVFRSSDQGLHWSRVESPISSPLSYTTERSGGILAGSTGGLYRSTDRGTSWSHIDIGEQSAHMFSVVESRSNVILAATAHHGIRRSTDGGSTWSDANNGLDGVFPYELITDSSVVLLGTTGGIYGSTNDGENWVLLLQNTIASSFALAGNGGILAATDSGTISTTDGGRTWRDVGNGLPDGGFLRIASNRAGTCVVAAKTGGVFVSRDWGRSWIQFDSGLPHNQVRVLEITASGFVLAGVSGSGFFIAELPDVVLPALPTSFDLGQNYPNPFNAGTWIEYSVPANSEIRVAVYDLLGRLVTRVVSDVVPAGTYRANWIPRSISSGMYFYRLESGRVTVTKKLLYLK